MAARNFGAKEKNTEVLALLKDQIKNNTPARVYLFHGDEPFLIDHSVNDLKKLVLDNDSQSLNLITFEGKLNINSLIDACDTYPVFAERKLVLVKNSSFFYSKSKKETPSSTDEDTDGEENTSGEEPSDTGNKAQDALKQYIPEIPDTTCLIFVETQVDKRLGTYKQVAKYGLPVEYSRMGPSELVSWVAKGVKSLGKVISEDAAQYLVAVSEPDMYSLKNEIMKLGAYTGERKQVMLEDVKLMALPTIKSVIFDLLDAVAQRNSPKALKLLDDMLTIKEPEQKILSMLSKQTGEILKLKLLLSKNASQAQINQFFQGKHPYALKMLISQAQRMEIKYLKELLKSCMDAEARYKKGLISAQLALEVLLSRISEAGR